MAWHLTFETDAYLYVGEDQLWKLSLETERDLLLLKKLIGKPYLKADVVLQDESRYASKTGLSSLQAGFQTRYEINKRSCHLLMSVMVMKKV